MLPALFVSLYDNTGDTPAFLFSIALILLLGLPMMLLSKPQDKTLRPREGFVSVGLTWLLMSAFGALPFMFAGTSVYYWDAFFEATSGFTTTGASILTNVEIVGRGVLFWRSFMHWVGGMGVLVLTLAVMPKVSGRGSILAKAESPGPTFSKMMPKMTDTARFLYLIYALLTVVEFLLLLIAGMPLYDSVIHAMGTAGTGGFSNRNQSVGAYNNVWIEIIVTVFMFLFGTNFIVYFHILRGEGRKAFKNEEVRFYYALALTTVLLIALFGIPEYGNFFNSLRYSGFQVAAIMSTTGFSTADFNLWPQFSRILLIVLMLIGACAGSTAGGMKVVRAVLLGKASAREIGHTLQPRKVRLVKIDQKPVSEDTLKSVFVFFFIYMAFLFLGTLIASTDGHDFVTSFSAVASCLSNIGPGLELVGPSGNFSIFSPHVKYLLSFLMLAGRLEFIPILVLFHPAIWKKAGH